MKNYIHVSFILNEKFISYLFISDILTIFIVFVGKFPIRSLIFYFLPIGTRFSLKIWIGKKLEQIGTNRNTVKISDFDPICSDCSNSALVFQFRSNSKQSEQKEQGKNFRLCSDYVPIQIGTLRDFPIIFRYFPFPIFFPIRDKNFRLVNSKFPIVRFPFPFPIRDRIGVRFPVPIAIPTQNIN